MLKNLPTDYSKNLAELPDEQRQAIEEDKQRWFEASKMINNHGREYIMSMLFQMPEDKREDMRRRLNTLRKNRK